MEEIKKRVDNMLVDRGLVKDYPDQTVRELLYHLFVAIDIYRYMTIAEKNKSGYWFRLFRGSYTLRNFLKERKRKRDKEKSPLHPSYKKESGVKEKAQNNTHTAERESSVGGVELMVRKEAFYRECMAFRDRYDENMLLDFYAHWAEDVVGKDKMLFEAERSWNTSHRLRIWSTSEITKAREAAAIRQKRTRKKQQEEQTAAEKQQVQAAQREADNQRREQEMEESRKGKVSTEEYIRQHPDSMVARLYREQQAKEAKTASRSPSGKTDKASGEVADKKGGAP